jgi:hypothetical protein
MSRKSTGSTSTSAGGGSSNGAQSVKVFCRIRPSNKTEVASGGVVCVKYTDEMIEVKSEEAGEHKFNFDRILGMEFIYHHDHHHHHHIITPPPPSSSSSSPLMIIILIIILIIIIIKVWTLLNRRCSLSSPNHSLKTSYKDTTQPSWHMVRVVRGRYVHSYYKNLLLSFLLFFLFLYFINNNRLIPWKETSRATSSKASSLGPLMRSSIQ